MDYKVVVDIGINPPILLLNFKLINMKNNKPCTYPNCRCNMGTGCINKK